MSNTRFPLTSRIIALTTAASVLAGCETMGAFKKRTVLSSSTPNISLQYGSSDVDSTTANKSRLCVENYLLKKGVNDYVLNSPNYTILVPKDLGKNSLNESDLDSIKKQCYTENGEIDISKALLTGAGLLAIIGAASSLGGGGGGGSKNSGNNVTPVIIPGPGAGPGGGL